MAHTGGFGEGVTCTLRVEFSEQDRRLVPIDLPKSGGGPVAWIFNRIESD